MVSVTELCKIIDKIRKLSIDRKWGNICISWSQFEEKGYHLSIGRYSLEKYKKEQRECTKINYSGIIPLQKHLDEQLVEVIRHFIPEAKNIVFGFYSSDSSKDNRTSSVESTKNIVH